MNVLIAGGDGQLGRAVADAAPASATVFRLGRGQLDITDQRSVDAAILSTRPATIVNTAAYTAVDRAETESAQAFEINACGAERLAIAAKACGARMIQVSTDFVFSGGKSFPYLPNDKTGPVNVYGASKLDGENRVAVALPNRSVILRTAWLYSASGASFVKTVLKLLASKSELRIISDQTGSPTTTSSLAIAIWRIINNQEIHGIYHWTDAGLASWYDFAVAIKEEALAIGLIDDDVPVFPVSTIDYGSAVHRPYYSVLDKTKFATEFGVLPEHWRTNLRATLKEMKSSE